MPMTRHELLDRLAQAERTARARIVDGLLESTKLAERREWLSTLDLVVFMFQALASSVEELLVQLPDDNAASVRAWMLRRRDAQQRALQESTFQRRSRRVYMLGLLDQWEPGCMLVDDAIDSVWRGVTRKPVEVKKTES